MTCIYPSLWLYSGDIRMTVTMTISRNTADVNEGQVSTCHIYERKCISHPIGVRVFDVLIGSDMLATRFSLALGALIWGLLLLWPGDLFPTAAQIAAGKGRTTYALMAQVMSENSWGAMFLIQGITMVFAIFSQWRNKVLFVADALLGAILWTAATVMCFAAHFNGWMSYEPPAAMSAEIALMFASWWHLIRYMLDMIWSYDNGR